MHTQNQSHFSLSSSPFAAAAVVDKPVKTRRDSPIHAPKLTRPAHKARLACPHTPNQSLATPLCLLIAVWCALVSVGLGSRAQIVLAKRSSPTHFLSCWPIRACVRLLWSMVTPTHSLTYTQSLPPLVQRLAAKQGLAKGPAGA